MQIYQALSAQVFSLEGEKLYNYNVVARDQGSIWRCPKIYSAQCSIPLYAVFPLLRAPGGKGRSPSPSGTTQSMPGALVFPIPCAPHRQVRCSSIRVPDNSSRNPRRVLIECIQNFFLSSSCSRKSGAGGKRGERGKGV